MFAMNINQILSSYQLDYTMQQKGCLIADFSVGGERLQSHENGMKIREVEFKLEKTSHLI